MATADNSYRLQGLSGDRWPANTSTTGSVSVGGSVSGVIQDSRDKDWFRIRLVAGYRYQFNLGGYRSTNSPHGPIRDPALRLRGANGIILAYNDNISSSNYNSRITFTAKHTGYYYLEASGGPHGDVGLYRLSAKQVSAPRDDFSANRNTTGRVSAGGYATGIIETSGDQDWFRVYLTGGRYYTINLEGAPTNRGTCTDPYIRGICNSKGRYISNTTDDDGGTGNNARLGFRPSSSGYYYISAGAYGSRTGTYRLSVSSGAAALGSMSQQNLVFNGGNAQGLSNAAATPLSAALDKEWQRYTLAFSRG